MVRHKNPDQYAYKYVTISLVVRNIPLVLGVEPVQQNSKWDENPPIGCIASSAPWFDELNATSRSTPCSVTANSTE
ncbi:hypothetical protein JMJ58_20410 [Haloterrigena salifodinae]|uniref:Uncharacterized protein n=1 Tax=Haloterrigena salifodinae TaxID=2675099 RepID=A0A8T8E141_9EURY|nr:hypothetical protein [Haloterrigena salifodinae]QRV15233.1 hypothetical protein JMJ58_20410 [Haloterrigena salifodinae]